MNITDFIRTDKARDLHAKVMEFLVPLKNTGRDVFNQTYPDAPCERCDVFVFGGYVRNIVRHTCGDELRIADIDIHIKFVASDGQVLVPVSLSRTLNIVSESIGAKYVGGTEVHYALPYETTSGLSIDLVYLPQMFSFGIDFMCNALAFREDGRLFMHPDSQQSDEIVPHVITEITMNIARQAQITIVFKHSEVMHRTKYIAVIGKCARILERRTKKMIELGFTSVE